MEFDNVIFVCMGNTCRSPMAAACMAKMFPDIISESRGMVVLFPEPYNPKAVAVAAKHGVVIVNDSAKQLKNEDFGIHTLVLTMDYDMKQKIYDEYTEAINVYAMGEFAGTGQKIIADPYGKGVEDYNVCFEEISSHVEKVIDRIKLMAE